ncbi:hypothetical protein LZZ85_00790 [Terrimonas sp. NA20]|uniref:Uncharacterized protein n=1 Tax=Terrimonas ginsenosidimutans TaxID=2908004 RepID=A0ABS9KKD8_9BACT|nr:hypothetical protein [Terrimonas ginsenosidimutans]MCG2612787.1 hypothetical protein [Terrimonas ginsenosidimutans]
MGNFCNHTYNLTNYQTKSLFTASPGILAGGRYENKTPYLLLSTHHQYPDNIAIIT